MTVVRFKPLNKLDLAEYDRVFCCDSFTFTQTLTGHRIMLSKNKSVKLEDLFNVRFSTLSTSVDKTSDREWHWGTDPRFAKNIVCISRIVKKRTGDQIATTLEFLPMAEIRSPEDISIDQFADNWKALGYTGPDKTTAKTSLQKFVDRELKAMGIMSAIGDRFIDYRSTVIALSDKFERSGVTEESGRDYLAAMFSAEAKLLGKKFTTYYDVTPIKHLALPSADSDTTIAKTPKTPKTPKTAKTQDTSNDGLDTLEKPELIQMCKDLNLEFRPSYGGKRLISIIREAMNSQAVDPA
jgi:hypothetical protein